MSSENVVLCDYHGGIKHAEKPACFLCASASIRHKPLDFVSALAIADRALGTLKSDYPRWWRRIDDTPLPNDIAVRIAVAFVEQQEN